MPALYAHYRFGARVSRCLDGDLKDIVKKYHAQFVIGLQGPDLFFFYRPWSLNRVSKYGYHLHSLSAAPFFEHGISVVKEKGRDSGEYAYLLGFLCHFILDSECHPYVEEMIRETGVQHLEIEEEFENMDQDTVKQSLNDLRMVKKLFHAPGAVKQDVINTVMKLLGKYDKMKGLMNQRVDNPKCQKTNAGLMERFDRAVGIGAKMIRSFDDSVRTGCKLDERFDRTFE